MAFSCTQVMPLAAGATSSRMRPPTRGAGAAPNIRPLRTPGIARAAAPAKSFLREKRFRIFRVLRMNRKSGTLFGHRRPLLHDGVQFVIARTEIRHGQSCYVRDPAVLV